jgi:hypothetical protein
MQQNETKYYTVYFKGFNKYVTFQPLYANTIEDISQYDVCKFISNLQFLHNQVLGP